MNDTSSIQNKIQILSKCVPTSSFEASLAYKYSNNNDFDGEISVRNANVQNNIKI